MEYVPRVLPGSNCHFLIFQFITTFRAGENKNTQTKRPMSLTRLRSCPCPFRVSSLRVAHAIMICREPSHPVREEGHRLEPERGGEEEQQH